MNGPITQLVERVTVVRLRAPVSRNLPSAQEVWDQFFSILEREKFTGKVVVEMNCGGIRKIEAEDHKRLPT